MRLTSPAPYRALLAAAILGPALLLAAIAWWSWDRVNLEAAAEISRRVDVLYEHVIRVFQSDKMILGWIDGSVARLDRGEIERRESRLHIMLKNIVDNADEVEAAFIAGADGELEAMSRGYPVPSPSGMAPSAANVRDRPYFAEARESAEIVVDGPYQGRVSGRPIFDVVRRLSAPHGEFRGIAAVVVSPSYFTTFWKGIVAPGDTVGLVREDGVVLARYPEMPHPGDAPLRFSASTMARMRAAPSGAIVPAPPSPIDGIRRLIAFRKLEGYPLYIAYGLDDRNILRDWLPTLGAFAGLAVAAALGLLLTSLFVVRRARGEAEALRLAESAAAALRESEARYRALYEQTPAPMHACAKDLTILAVSDSWLELMGYQRHEVIGRKLTEFQTPATAAHVTATAWPRLLERGAIRGAEGQYVCKSGKLIDVLVSARVERGGDGEFLHVLGVLTDMTEQRRVEAELRQAQKMEVVGQMTGGVAHDFGNLLTAIIGNVDMLQKRATDPQMRRLLHGAMTAAESAAGLTQRLLAFARKQHLDPMPVDLQQLVAGMQDLLARTLGPAVEVSVSADAGLWPALVDRNQIELVILNLAINARDAMPEGGALGISLANRAFSAAAPAELAAGDYVVLTVADTGTGMDEATLARAVEPFYTTKEAGKGTGLGLSMVHGIAVQSGGALRITSELGRGTAVEVWLPRSREAPVGSGETAAAPVETGSGTILVCEDTSAVRDFIADALEESGYDVIATATGAAALAVLDDGTPVDLLLVDFAMPGMNGGAVARLARERRPDLPVLLVTGNIDQAALAPDAAGLPTLRKPFKRTQLLAHLGRLLPGSQRVPAS